MTITLYHNPRCSKSRQAKELLDKKGLDFTVREYLKEPLNAKELQTLVSLLNIPAHDLLRNKEPEYQEAGLSKDSSDEDIINAMVNTPKLMERPVLVTEKGARIGRPTELLEEIL
ncbi:MAG: arsenate reductase (glutaredoxin) [Reinekea sp.]